MGAYKYIKQTLQKQYKERDATFRAKIISWRHASPIQAVDYPSNLTRARTLGYKAKQGYIVVRTRIDKGRRTRRKPMGGRKHKNFYRFVQPGMSHQAMAEQRVNRVYKNMEVLNSYWVGEDGNYKYFEVILADPTKATVNISSVMRTGKAFRGLTSAGNSGTPNKQKGWNKKLRRKLARKPFHYVPYVKSEKVEAPERKAPLMAAPAPKKSARKAAAVARAEHKHPHAAAHAHAEHGHAEHAEHKPAEHAHHEEHAEHKPAEHAHHEEHAEHKHPHEQKKA
jgi:large subunit ribosomal protein L15e